MSRYKYGADPRGVNFDVKVVKELISNDFVSVAWSSSRLNPIMVGVGKWVCLVCELKLSKSIAPRPRYTHNNDGISYDYREITKHFYTYHEEEIAWTILESF